MLVERYQLSRPRDRAKVQETLANPDAEMIDLLKTFGSSIPPFMLEMVTRRQQEREKSGMAEKIIKQPAKESEELDGIHREPSVITAFEEEMNQIRQKIEPEFLDLVQKEGLQFVWKDEMLQLEWDRQEVDWRRFDAIAPWLDSDMSDAEFKTIIRQGSNADEASIELFLRTSPLFSILDNGNRVIGNDESPLEHILRVLEGIKTDELDPQSRRALRWLVFFHDLGKVVSPNNLNHGWVSSLMARSYVAHTRKNPERSPKIDDEFSDLLQYFCEFHHLFQRAAQFLYKKNKTERAKMGSAFVASNHYAKRDAENAWYEAMGQAARTKTLFRQKQFREFFPRVSQDPHLFDLFYFFTVADVASNEKYEKYLIENYFFYKELKAAIDRHASKTKTS